MGDQPPFGQHNHPGVEPSQPMEDHGSAAAGTELLNPNVTPREHVISTAITFLQNTSVKRNPLQQKQQFLRSKGLTEDEIQIACDRAGAFSGSLLPGVSADAMHKPHSTVINMGISSPNKYGHGSSAMMGSGQVAPAKSMLQQVRDIFSSTALVAGVAYAIYLFYKNYIRPLLFGDGSSGGSGSSSGAGGSARKRRRKSPEELMEDMSRSVEKSVASINQELTRVKEEMARNARQDSLHREISGFKADLDAIKGLLLNRKQFAAPMLPPSIPAWQLQAANKVFEESSEKPDDAGSGSSETEVVTKNSDSSIELI